MRVIILLRMVRMRTVQTLTSSASGAIFQRPVPTTRDEENSRAYSYVLWYRTRTRMRTHYSLRIFKGTEVCIDDSPNKARDTQNVRVRVISRLQDS